MYKLMSPYKLLYLTAALAMPVGLTACGNLAQIADAGAQVSQAMGYNPSQLAGGVKEVLELSSTRAADALGVAGGYSNSQQYRIKLPQAVQDITDPLRSFGLGGYIDSVEQLMNDGAEKAAGEAKTLFIAAVKDMSVNDAIGIVRGGDNAATDYFRSQTESQLRAKYQPIMQSQLKQLGFYGDYQQLLNAYKLVPLPNKPSLDLEEHAIQLGMDALFEQVALEEQKIRANPMEQGSALISSVLSR